jgi:transcriptional regulator with XRE-family HTH domain
MGREGIETEPGGRSDRLFAGEALALPAKDADAGARAVPTHGPSSAGVATASVAPRDPPPRGLSRGLPSRGGAAAVLRAPNGSAPTAGEPASQTDGYQHRLGARLRAARRARGLRLQDVELRSGGRFKAVVIGSYERGDRAISAHRLAALATFYDVPLEELLPSDGSPRRVPAKNGDAPLALDRLRHVDDLELQPLARLVHHIQWQRGDYNGRILTLRADDLRTLAIALGVPPEGLTAWLDERGLLATD